MKLWLIVPVKPLNEGKSRLADVLSPANRVTLNRQLLQGVLTTTQKTGLMAGTLVVSRDDTVLSLARSKGAQVLREAGSGLNPALVQARQLVIRSGADALLVLPSDLPLITSADVCNLVDLVQGDVAMVMAPSRDGGTNALLLRPPHLIDFAFGPDSFQRHKDLAAAQGHACTVFHSPTLAYDVDWPEDLPLLA